MTAKVSKLNIVGNRVEMDLTFPDQPTRDRFVMGVFAAGDSLVVDGPAPAVTTAPAVPKAKPKPKAVAEAAPEPVAEAAPEPVAEAAPEPVAEVVADDEPTASTAVPKELVEARSFKAVMEWMIANGHDDAANITAMLEEWVEQIPSAKRLGANLGERVGRALEVLAKK